jgi:peptidyl-prolyl cis-trans isomerase-like protein 2
MLQGGDPGGDGRGGKSVWGQCFADELTGPWTHDARGILSMANKGKDTNTSQFFITYAPAPHLDRKHTVFGRVMVGLDVLTTLEAIPSDGSDRPLHDIIMKSVSVFVDPFTEFRRQKMLSDVTVPTRQQSGIGSPGNETTTWTGKRILQGDDGPSPVERVGRYIIPLDTNPTISGHDSLRGEPAMKRPRTGGFGNFDNW